MSEITGTLSYQAPEMVLGKNYSKKVDMWALGVILYEVISGDNPFYANLSADTKKNII